MHIEKHIADLASALASQNEAMVRGNVRKVDALAETMGAAAVLDNRGTQNSFLQAATEAYFAATQSERDIAVQRIQEIAGDVPACLADDPAGSTSVTESEPVSDEGRNRICRFIAQHGHEVATGRAVARIFHGLSSPTCPAAQWSWCVEWGCMAHVDFDAIRQCAQTELIRIHCQTVADNSGASQL
ncbi:hypothetical protein EC988_006110 [Linderina pennispora]|nr:hypothetical protein EC988_006110 [Linderina pennispora]